MRDKKVKTIKKRKNKTFVIPQGMTGREFKVWKKKKREKQKENV